MGHFDKNGVPPLSSHPTFSSANRIDALQRSRTHLGKEKQNLEGERNALNKVVKEVKLEVTQCQKELKRLKLGRTH